jgi:hypothetical protein
MPTLFPLIVKSPLLNCPAFTVLLANTSKTGKPAIVLTDIKESERSSIIENNPPFVPSALIKVSPEVVDTACIFPNGVTVPTPRFPTLNH